MGMNTHVVGIKPPNEKWKKMKEVWDACESAEIEPPKEVYDFFEGEGPDEKGVRVNLNKQCCSKFKADCQEGLEIDLTKISSDIKIVRFYNSW